MHIIEPNTLVKYPLFSYKGKETLKNYIKLFKKGGSKKTGNSKKKKSSSRTATTEEIKKDPLYELVNKLMKEYKGKVHNKYKHTDYKDKEFKEIYKFLEKNKKFQDYNKIMKSELVKGRIYNTSYYWRYKIFLKR